MYGTCMVHVWYMYGTCMIHVWYMYGTSKSYVLCLVIGPRDSCRCPQGLL